ncbi:MAG: class I SAM-dependent methyltransferase [Candidatus Bathyarchaeia archaeon]
MEEGKLENYWDYVALEAKDFEKWRRLEKWRKVARNWLVDYADKRAYDFVLKVLDDVIKMDKSAKILDVGCGPGKWSRFFAKKFDSVTAIDLSSKMVRLAEENARKRSVYNVDFCVMDVSKLNFSDEAYDFVNCVTVLQHMHDDECWRMAIREIVRVTKSGGYMLLFETAPNLAVIKRTRHLKIRTMQQYIEEFKNAGASLVYWRAVDLSLPITIFGLRAYAASFNKRVYYFISKNKWIPAGLLSFLSWAAALLAEFIDYRLAETPLSFLSFGRILLFKKN